jgi:hypothetical protein
MTISLYNAPSTSRYSIGSFMWVSRSSDTEFNAFFAYLMKDIENTFKIKRISKGASGEERNNQVKESLIYIAENLPYLNRNRFFSALYIRNLLKGTLHILSDCKLYENSFSDIQTLPSHADELAKKAKNIQQNLVNSLTSTKQVKIEKIELEYKADFSKEMRKEYNISYLTSDFPNLVKEFNSTYSSLLTLDKMDFNAEDGYIITQILDSYLPSIVRNSSTLRDIDKDIKVEVEAELLKQLDFINSEIKRIKQKHHNLALNEIRMQSSFFDSIAERQKSAIEDNLPVMTFGKTIEKVR